MFRTSVSNGGWSPLIQTSRVPLLSPGHWGGVITRESITGPHSGRVTANAFRQPKASVMVTVYSPPGNSSARDISSSGSCDH